MVIMFRISSVGGGHSQARAALLLALIYSHVIDEHRLWELGRRVGIAGPPAADGDVEDEMKLFIEWGRKGVSPRVPFRFCVIEFAIDIPAHPARSPIQSEDMKVIGETSGWQHEILSA